MAQDGHSTTGAKWNAFVASKGGEEAWAKEAQTMTGAKSGCPLFDKYGFPIVQVVVKINKIISITEVEHKFHIEFTVMTDWPVVILQRTFVD